MHNSNQLHLGEIPKRYGKSTANKPSPDSPKKLCIEENQATATILSVMVWPLSLRNSRVRGGQMRTSSGDTPGFYLAVALVVARAAASPGDKVL